VIGYNESMPYSYSNFDTQIRQHILESFPDRLIPILDVGPGAGKYAKLLPEFPNKDAIEVFSPYVERFALKSMYRHVLIGDIRSFVIWRGCYQLAIFGDVLEHLNVTDAQMVLSKFFRVGCRLLVVVPYLFPQDSWEGNDFERHLQSDLTLEVMNERYPNLKLLCNDSQIGVYIS
jgi:hypothetical protein